MGKSYSKEEVVIAQNNAIESKVTKYEMGFAVMATAVALIAVLVLCRHFRHRVKKMVHKEIQNASGVVTVLPGRVETRSVPQQPPQASYA